MVAQDPTKSRLLEAAGEEFAEKGFELARVRAICDRAGANLAAINYHFGDKEHLYVEVLREAHRCGLDPQGERFDRRLSPAERLRTFIHHFLGRVLAMNQPEDWQHRLMLREMLSPTPFSEVLVREMIRPRFELIEELDAGDLSRGRRPPLECPGVQCDRAVPPLQDARRVTERLIGDEGYRALDLDYLTDHITAFCLAALGMGPTLNQAGEPSEQERNVSARS